MRTDDHDRIADALVAQMRERLLAEFEVIAARFEADIRSQVRSVDWRASATEAGAEIPHMDTITNESMDASLDLTWTPY